MKEGKVVTGGNKEEEEKREIVIWKGERVSKDRWRDWEKEKEGKGSQRKRDKTIHLGTFCRVGGFRPIFHHGCQGDAHLLLALLLHPSIHPSPRLGSRPVLHWGVSTLKSPVSPISLLLSSRLLAPTPPPSSAAPVPSPCYPRLNAPSSRRRGSVCVFWVCEV